MREDMVEKEAAAAVRAVNGVEREALRAIGLIALELTVDRWRRDRVAVLQRLRLKADMVKLAYAVPGRRQCSFEQRREEPYACV